MRQLTIAENALSRFFARYSCQPFGYACILGDVKPYVRVGLAVTGALALFSFARSVMLVRDLLSKDPVEVASQKVRYHFSIYLPEDRAALFADLVAGARESAASSDAAVSVHTYDGSGRDLLIARYTGTNGIIICPDLDDKVTASRLEEFRKVKIPVVLVNHNIAADKPWPFVGTNSYDYGMKAGMQIEPGEGKNINLAVLYSEKSPALFAERELFEMGITGVLGNSLASPVSVQRTDMNPRDAEKIVYQLVREQGGLNAIVFTSKEDTLAGTQALIDLNLVGRVQIIGSGMDRAILDYIQKGIIRASLATNPRATGYQAVESLAELCGSGYTSTSVDTGIDVITRDNVDTFKVPSGKERE